jgi:hypothetical protein
MSKALLDHLPPEAQRARILSLAEAAAMHGVSLVHYRRMIKRGDVTPPRRIGARKLGQPLGAVLDDLQALTAMQPRAA